MKYHLTAIGGAVMHNLAIALKEMGHDVTGSDDEIFDPAKSRLAERGLLPPTVGWDVSRIRPDLDAVILGMHAKADNPELARALELGLKVWSFPEFMYHHSQQKFRTVIAGSHGKTTITSMILHVLKGCGRNMDYLVGAKLRGFDTMVRLTPDAPLLVVEGDEYLSSPIDRRPKFLHYHPQLALISGVAWDHINVFPTYPEYLMQFRLLIRSLDAGSALVYCADDPDVVRLVEEESSGKDLRLLPYRMPEYRIADGKYQVKIAGEWVVLELIGRHNLLNLSGALCICRELGIPEKEFAQHIATFTGAANRLEKILDNGRTVIFRDFAHSPSKVKATVEAVEELFGKDQLIACLELHTFSSLNKSFLSEYKGALKAVNKKIVFVSAHALELKRLPPISGNDIREGFDDAALVYVQEPGELIPAIKKLMGPRNVLLLMSSGNFGGVEWKEIAAGG